MTKILTFTKRVAKSGRGYLIWIPKDVVDFIPLKEDDTVEIKLKKLEKKK
jgi:antitoxin component of MazEF toxin-antitoxin module|tara:strand:+ start:273 stop:422 length:150 start_codon:yes stop_codon:yes gene_type:complete